MNELLIGAYVFATLVVFGFQLAKADSSFIETDWKFWTVAVIASLLSPITLPLIIGSKIHGDAL